MHASDNDEKFSDYLNIRSSFGEVTESDFGCSENFKETTIET